MHLDRIKVRRVVCIYCLVPPRASITSFTPGTCGRGGCPSPRPRKLVHRSRRGRAPALQEAAVTIPLLSCRALSVGPEPRSMYAVAKLKPGKRSLAADVVQVSSGRRAPPRRGSRSSSPTNGAVPHKGCSRTRGVRACIRRVAGCATPNASAGHTGATANLKSRRQRVTTSSRK
jgi:hypothetical protein